MVKDCKTYGVADPILKEDGVHLILEFPGLGIGEGIRDGVNGIVIEGVSDGVNDSLNRLITLLNTTPGMNAKYAMHLFYCSACEWIYRGQKVYQ